MPHDDGSETSAYRLFLHETNLAVDLQHQHQPPKRQWFETCGSGVFEGASNLVGRISGGSSSSDGPRKRTRNGKMVAKYLHRSAKEESTARRMEENVKERRILKSENNQLMQVIFLVTFSSADRSILTHLVLRTEIG